MTASAFLGSVLILGVPAALAGACREKPGVQMDERAAESHLITKKDPELPAGGAKLVRVRQVVVLVTVDREGAICDARPVSGPEELRKAAARAVKKHWKYRPFLVNWEPVVAQFPVSVNFIRRGGEPELRAGSTLTRSDLIGTPSPKGRGLSELRRCSGPCSAAL